MCDREKSKFREKARVETKLRVRDNMMMSKIVDFSTNRKKKNRAEVRGRRRRVSFRDKDTVRAFPVRRKS